jgi:hypothetical protein
MVGESLVKIHNTRSSRASCGDEPEIEEGNAPKQPRALSLGSHLLRTHPQVFSQLQQAAPFVSVKINDQPLLHTPCTMADKQLPLLKGLADALGI